MIIDTIENAHLYYALNPGIKAALRFLEDTDLTELPSGKHIISGDDCFALADEYKTRPREEKQWEAHQRYIDVQYIISGAERMGYTHVDALQLTKDYDDVKDIAFYQGEGDYFLAAEGTFVIFFPEDAHMPGLAVDEPEPVRKVVVKVKDATQR